MAAAQNGEDEGPLANINIIPFVDIVLVLLIIFMLTSIAIVRASMVVNLPKAATGGARVESTVNIVCNKDGSLMLNGAHSTVEEISRKVKITQTFSPQAANRAFYDELFGEFRTIYKQNKAMYRRLNGSEH